MGDHAMFGSTAGIRICADAGSGLDSGRGGRAVGGAESRDQTSGGPCLCHTGSPVDGHRFIRMSFAVSTPEVQEALRRMIPWFAARRAKAA